MDDDQIMQQQETPGGEEDDFLDGWEETGPVQEETDPGEGGGKQAGGQEEGQAADGGEPEDGGSRPVGGSGGEGLPPDGGSNGQPGSTAQPGSGGSGEEGLPPDGGGQEKGQPEGGQQLPPPPPKTWTLDYMGQAVTVSEADVPGLAQRALDYDRVRAAYDEAQPVMDLFRGFARQANLSVPEYVTRLRMQAKQLEGLDEAAARRAVEMEDREARVSAQEEADRARKEAFQRTQEAQRRRQERVQADIQEFISVFPDAAREFQRIPQDVWDAVNGGMSLVAAYARYNQAQSNAQDQAAEEEQQRREAVQQQNQKNAAASTGSMKSAGNNHGPKDPFLEGWDE